MSKPTEWANLYGSDYMTRLDENGMRQTLHKNDIAPTVEPSIADLRATVERLTKENAGSCCPAPNAGR